MVTIFYYLLRQVKIVIMDINRKFEIIKRIKINLKRIENI